MDLYMGGSINGATLKGIPQYQRPTSVLKIRNPIFATSQEHNLVAESCWQSSTGDQERIRGICAGLQDSG